MIKKQNDLPFKYKNHWVEENYPKFGNKRKDSIMWLFTDKLEYCLTRPTRVYFCVWLVIICLDIFQTVWSDVLTCLFLFCRNGNRKQRLWVSCSIRHLPVLYLSNAVISPFLLKKKKSSLNIILTPLLYKRDVQGSGGDG